MTATVNGTANAAGTEIAKPTKLFSQDQLAETKTFDQFVALTREMEIAVENVADYGTGFEVLNDKGALIGVPFAVAEFRFSQGDMGEFVSMAVFTQDNRKLIVNDGSTGIHDQMREIVRKRAAKNAPEYAPLYCGKGLRRSTYEVENPSRPGEMMSATTYYLAF